MKILISCKLIVCHGGKVCLIKFANKGYFSVLILIKKGVNLAKIYILWARFCGFTVIKI